MADTPDNNSIARECEALTEEVRKLIKAGKKPKVKILGVPFKIQNKQAFRECRMELHQDLQKPARGFEICLHEAAHWFFMDQSGVKNITFSGPRIDYDRANQLILPIGAEAKGDDADDSQTVDLALVSGVTKQHIAGGAVLRRYTTAKEFGDDDDFQKFLRRWPNRPAEMRQMDAKEFWGRMLGEVNQELDKPDTQNKIFKKTREYIGLLYK
jgi:hypothetical protein